MANTLAFCQQYLYNVLSHYCDKDNTLLYVYMDDLIIGRLEESGLAPWVTTIVDILRQYGFKIVRNVPLFHILGSQLTLTQANVNQLQFIQPEILTFLGLQKILGKMNWVMPWLPIETGKLGVLYDLL